MNAISCERLQTHFKMIICRNTRCFCGFRHAGGSSCQRECRGFDPFTRLRKIPASSDAGIFISAVSKARQMVKALSSIEMSARSFAKVANGRFLVKKRLAEKGMSRPG